MKLRYPLYAAGLALSATIPFLKSAGGPTDIELAPKSSKAVETAIRLGKFVGTDPATGAVRIHFKDNGRARAALAQLRADPNIAAAWLADYPFIDGESNTGPQYVKAALQRELALERAGIEREEEGESAVKENGMLRRQYLLRTGGQGLPDYQAAAKERDRMPAAQIRLATQSGAQIQTVPSGAWSYVGPNNMDAAPFQNIVTGMSPISGRINAVATDPANPAIIFAGAAGGGLRKSIDGGATWSSPSAKSWPFMNVSAIAVGPVGPGSQLVLCGLGDFPQSLTPYGGGIMRSTDGGGTWTQVGAGAIGGLAVSGIVIDPQDINVAVVTTGRGSRRDGSGAQTEGFVYRSTAGTDFTKITQLGAARWCDVELGIPNSAGARTLYAVGAGTNAPKLFRSLDMGVTWVQATLPAAQLPRNILDIAPSKVSSTTLYLLDPTMLSIWKSVDRGDTWTHIDQNFSAANWKQTNYNFEIACGKKDNKDNIYVGLVELFESPDGGTSWRELSGLDLHDDQHAVFVNPINPREIFIGCDGGAYKMSYGLFDHPVFTSFNKTLRVTQFYDLSVHPTDSTRMMGGAQDNGSPVAKGDLNHWVNVIGGDGGWSAINPTTPAIMYGTWQDGICRTDNEWFTNFPMSPSGMENEPNPEGSLMEILEMDASDPNRLYFGTDRLRRYNDVTKAWTAPLAGKVFGEISAIKANGSRIYLGTFSGQLWTSGDSGASWTRLDTLAGASSLPKNPVSSITMLNSISILVGYGGSGVKHLWRCNNTTAANPSWTAVSGNSADTAKLPDVPINCVAPSVDQQSNTWFVGTDLGVFMTTNGGLTWANATAPLGLPNVQVNDLVVMKSTGFLFAATFGRGIWKINIGAPAITLSGFALQKPVIVGNGLKQDGVGIATLSALSPITGAPVALTSSSPSVAYVPPSVNIGFNQTVGLVSVTPERNDSNVAHFSTITASYGGVSKFASLKVMPNNNATYLAQSVSTSMVAGQYRSVSVTMRNTGTTTWRTSDYVLRNISNPLSWQMPSVKPTANVAPNGQMLFSFPVLAPETEGTYPFQWQMQQLDYFGQKTPVVNVVVSVAPNAARCTGVGGVPTTIVHGTPMTIYVTMRNVGSNTWTAAGGYSVKNIGNAAWGAPLPMGTVTLAKGQEYTFIRNMNAPATPGTYRMMWQMQQNGLTFGNASAAIDVVVT